MNVRSYAEDVRRLLATHWWFTVIALPVAAFGVPLYLYASRAFGPRFAVQLTTWYALAGVVVVLAVAVAQTVWSRVLANDTDHLVE
ncbi:hypothetical protein G9C85_11535 [Halorubellus sp. JP-L1]|uniref:hypothetical protein n=1 Tax=Halorubellus sp. JP-L1 TaxID=2715753 RepID=UPI00140E7020|nr:hypothetical protein [Halorubellus sp. JP-L1]NHN42252.1 hypothetical protein [Halorubellus sp. JP-L1]